MYFCIENIKKTDMEQNSGFKIIGKRELFNHFVDCGMKVSYATFWRKVKLVFAENGWETNKSHFFNSAQHRAIVENLQ